MAKVHARVAEKMRAQKRGLIPGMLIGAAVVVSAMATAQSTTSWFAGLFSTGGSDSGGTTDTTLISQQDSVVATEINADAASCAQGAAGTVGAAIQTAAKAHETIASATPQTGSLFDPTGASFSSISQIFDLSFAIPSLSSIVDAAEAVLTQYAKKTWTANTSIAGLVTTPLNQAISDVNQIPGFSDINGMSGAGMSSVDPQLGAQYQGGASTSNYTANTNPFNATQTTFTSGTSGTTGQVTNNAAQINTLTQGIGNQQMTVNQDQANLQNAQAAYNACMTSNTGCAAELASLQSAQNAMVSDQTSLITLQEQLSQGISQSSSTVPVVSPPMAVPAAAVQRDSVRPSATGAPTTNSSWWSGVGKLFN